MKPVLVTGAAGFIGYHIAQRLLVDGRTVVGVDNLNSYYDPKLKKARLARLLGQNKFHFEQRDLADRHAIAALFAAHRFVHVVHLAAQPGVRYSLVDPHAYVDANLVGFLNILEGCRQVGSEHLIYASSSCLRRKYPHAVTRLRQHRSSAEPLWRHQKGKRIDGA
jgi:UDP-glucuronate 4-epimerase